MNRRRGTEPSGGRLATVLEEGPGRAGGIHPLVAGLWADPGNVPEDWVAKAFEGSV